MRLAAPIGEGLDYDDSYPRHVRAGGRGGHRGRNGDLAPAYRWFLLVSVAIGVVVAGV